jgi:hypothetical protein
MTAVLVIGHLGAAIDAERGIGWHQGAGSLAVARLADLEGGVADRRNLGMGQLVHSGERRQSVTEPIGKIADHGRMAFDLDRHPARVIHHPPTKPHLGGDPMHRRPKSNSLNRTLTNHPNPSGSVGHGCESWLFWSKNEERRTKITAKTAVRRAKLSSEVFVL